MLAIATTMNFCEAIIYERIDIAIRDGKDAATFTAIATIRPTKWTKFFTAKRSNAIAAITSNHFNFCFIDKFHNLPPESKKALPAAEPFMQEC
jgi:hypothetical protein